MAPQNTRPLFNARTQQLENATLSVDANNEIVATFADGSFVKFPAGLSKEQFETAIAEHQKSNEGQEVITPELEAQRAAQRAASEALIGNTMPEGQSNVGEQTQSTQQQ